MDILIDILIMGWVWNFIIFFKNLIEVTNNIRTGFNYNRLKHVKVLGVIYNKGYIPYYTLLYYSPFMSGYLKYKKLYTNSDAIDYIHYKSLKKYSGDIK